MSPFKAMTLYPATWGRIAQRAQEIAASTGCAMSPLAARAADGRLTVIFESESELDGGVIIAKPILEAVP